MNDPHSETITDRRDITFLVSRIFGISGTVNSPSLCSEWKPSVMMAVNRMESYDDLDTDETETRSAIDNGSLRSTGRENCFLQPLRTLRTSGWLVILDMSGTLGLKAEAMPDR